MRLLLAGTLILLIWNADAATAQDNAVLPPARFLTSIPFTILNGGIILGKVRVDSFPDSLNFIFDTGCGGISLDSLTADRLKLTPRLSPNTIRGIGGVRQQ